MNLEKLQALSDDELNKLSGAKVMGWVVRQWAGDWNPTVDMNDAMQLLGKFNHVRMKNNHSGGWIVSIGAFDEYQPTLPKAITITSILAKESE